MTSPRPWMDPSVPVEERVDLLLAAMTLEEKIGQMNQVANISLDHGDAIRAGRIGSSLSASGPLAGNVRDKGVAVSLFNKVQKIAVEESRLGIPILFARDVIHGHRTVFPIPLGQAASWDPELVREAASVAAKEAWADGLRWTFTPMVDISRDPRWGRIAESFGEDPCLASRMAEAAVRGYQGDDLSKPYRIAATAKHFAAYGGAEGGRDYNTVNLGEHALRNEYLPPFEAAVKAGVATIMSSFNEIDGVPVAANRRLLTEILRHEWGFDGLVVSDWGSIWQLTHMAVASTEEEAARLAAVAGNDVDMCDGMYIKHLGALVEEGRMSLAVVDEAVRRILRIKLRLGLFERPFADEKIREHVMLTPEHRSVARRLAAESVVLLKNNGLLPLRRDFRKLLLTGPFVNCRQEMLGTWTLDGRGEDVVNMEEAVRKALAPGCSISVDNGLNYGDLTPILARDADVVVFCLGEGYWRSGEANSVATIDLPTGQMEAVRAIRDLGKPIVSIVFAGRPCAIQHLVEWSDAVLYAWHPGVEAGNAVCDVLFGDVNPSGRIPATFPRTTGQIPTHYNHKPTGRPASWNDPNHGRYRDILDSPLFAFGYGLSYTTFAYADLKLSSGTMAADGRLTVTAELRNTGSRPGTEVVQLYVRDLVGSVTRPVKELKAFQRVTLAAGASATVAFELRADDLAFHGADLVRRVEPGEHLLWVGPNSQEGLEGRFRVV